MITTLILTILLALFYGVMLMNVTLVYFAGIMRFQEMRDAGRFKDDRMLWIWALCNTAFGVLLDAAINVFPFSLFFWEWPQWKKKEFLTTARLCRHFETAPDSWRGKQAARWGKILLNPIDPSGQHVK